MALSHPRSISAGVIPETSGTSTLPMPLQFRLLPAGRPQGGPRRAQGARGPSRPPGRRDLPQERPPGDPGFADGPAASGAEGHRGDPHRSVHRRWPAARPSRGPLRGRPGGGQDLQPSHGRGAVAGRALPGPGVAGRGGGRWPRAGGDAGGTHDGPLNGRAAGCYAATPGSRRCSGPVAPITSCHHKVYLPLLHCYTSRGGTPSRAKTPKGIEPPFFFGRYGAILRTRRSGVADRPNSKPGLVLDSLRLRYARPAPGSRCSEQLPFTAGSTLDGGRRSQGVLARPHQLGDRTGLGSSPPGIGRRGEKRDFQRNSSRGDPPRQAAGESPHLEEFVAGAAKASGRPPEALLAQVQRAQEGGTVPQEGRARSADRQARWVRARRPSSRPRSM